MAISFFSRSFRNTLSQSKLLVVRNLLTRIFLFKLPFNRVNNNIVEVYLTLKGISISSTSCCFPNIWTLVHLSLKNGTSYKVYRSVKCQIISTWTQASERESDVMLKTCTLIKSIKPSE